MTRDDEDERAPRAGTAATDAARGCAPDAPAGPGAMAWVVMGVSGCGKSTLGRALAQRLGARFVEGDALHPPENVRAMSEGRPLTDALREPWLRAVGDAAEAARREGEVVVACSALRRAYRDLLRARVGRLGFVFLDPPRRVLETRVRGRAGHFMPAGLLQSQLDTLEPPGPDEGALCIEEAGLTSAALDRALALIERNRQGA